MCRTVAYRSSSSPDRGRYYIKQRDDSYYKLNITAAERFLFIVFTTFAKSIMISIILSIVRGAPRYRFPKVRRNSNVIVHTTTAYASNDYLKNIYIYKNICIGFVVYRVFASRVSYLSVRTRNAQIRTNSNQRIDFIRRNPVEVTRA